MTRNTYNTALFGFGKIGAGYATDPVMAKAFPYGTHAQVLRDHKAFNWSCVVDPSDAALAHAKESWNLNEAVACITDLDHPEIIDVAVLATPPEHRIAIIEHLPNLRAVLIEKPLGDNLVTSKRFLEACAQRNILVQVNLPRRAEQQMVNLSQGERAQKIGTVQTAFATYGNGIANNGIHLIDLVRQIIGEVIAVEAACIPALDTDTTITHDQDIAFTLVTENQIPVMVSPLNFAHYREISLDIWGESGRLSILNEGYTLLQAKRGPNRLISTEREISSDTAIAQTTTIGSSMFAIYDNLQAALEGRESLLSPGDSAYRSMMIIEAIKLSHSKHGEYINLAEFSGL